MGLDWKYKFRSHWLIDNAEYYSNDHQGVDIDREDKNVKAPGLIPLA